MKNKKRVLALVLVAVLAITVFAACGKEKTEENSSTGESKTTSKEESKGKEVSTGLEDIQKKGKLVVGLDDTFAPMGFRNDSNELVGFDIDLAREVGKKLDVEVEFKTISWDAKEMELTSGKIDCVWNGMSITPEREAGMSLSKAYLGNSIIVMTNEGVTLVDKEDLVNYNIGIQAGSAALESLKADPVYDSVKDKVAEYPTYDEVIMDMKTGRLDCMIIDQVFGEYKNANLGGIYGVADFDFGADLYAIGFRKGDTELTEEVNKALTELQEEGKTAEISEKWFGKDLVLK